MVAPWIETAQRSASMRLFSQYATRGAGERDPSAGVVGVSAAVVPGRARLDGVGASGDAASEHRGGTDGDGAHDAWHVRADDAAGECASVRGEHVGDAGRRCTSTSRRRCRSLTHLRLRCLRRRRPRSATSRQGSSTSQPARNEAYSPLFTLAAIEAASVMSRAIGPAAIATTRQSIGRAPATPALARRVVGVARARQPADGDHADAVVDGRPRDGHAARAARQRWRRAERDACGGGRCRRARRRSRGRCRATRGPLRGAARAARRSAAHRPRVGRARRSSRASRRPRARSRAVGRRHAGRVAGRVACVGVDRRSGLCSCRGDRDRSAPPPRSHRRRPRGAARAIPSARRPIPPPPSTVGSKSASRSGSPSARASSASTSKRAAPPPSMHARPSRSRRSPRRRPWQTRPVAHPPR